jgi:phosphohistidine phosphatase
MKSLLLVRHAKSEWADPSLADYDRPLAERGKRDAPVMAHRLLDRKIRIDAFVSSPAKRAAKTAKIFAKEYGMKKGKIIFREELYLPSPAAFYDVIASMDNDLDSIALFSHNEGITEFANMLTDARVDNIPTAGVFALKAETDSWKKFREAKKEFWFFDFPKSTE